MTSKINVRVCNTCAPEAVVFTSTHNIYTLKAGAPRARKCACGHKLATLRIRPVFVFKQRGQTLVSLAMPASRPWPRFGFA